MIWYKGNPFSRSRGDRCLVASLAITAALAGAMFVLILVFLIGESLPSLRRVGVVRFLTDSGWRPMGRGVSGRFGLFPMLVGSLMVAGGALLIAVPMGVVSAVFSRFFAPRWVGRVYRGMIELLAGVPSVVYGFWGLVVLVPWINWLHPPGQSLLAGVLILSLMILPTVALLADAALRSVPGVYLSGAAALGMGRWAVVRGVALPAARGGILTGVLLAGARAIGETMAVVMVCGNVVQVPRSVFDPVRTITANIALEMGYATQQHRSALFVSGLVLMMLVGVLVVGMALIPNRKGYG